MFRFLCDSGEELFSLVKRGGDDPRTAPEPYISMAGITYGLDVEEKKRYVELLSEANSHMSDVKTAGFDLEFFTEFMEACAKVDKLRYERDLSRN
jgi:hypothetical protein